MEISSTKFLEPPPPLFLSQMEERLEGYNNGNKFLERFPIAATQRSQLTKKSVEAAPSTPGRPIFSFSVGNFSRKSVPSKWDDAEKWVVNGSSCHDSPSTAHHHGFKPPEWLRSSKHCNGVKPQEAAGEPEDGDDEMHSYMASDGKSSKPDVLFKDKFTRELGSIKDKPMNCCATSEVVHPEVVNLRDIGTSMTPIASSAPSKCHTPVMILSPAGHNTPADRSGPLGPSNSSSASTTDIMMQLQESHLAKLQLGMMHQDSTLTSNWSTREEEEDDVSKSLRHFEVSNECQGVSIPKPREAWDEEASKCCLRYQREEAQIQAWVNLQIAKAEAQSKKLEVKIQRMISKKEEKLMKRMAIVQRKAEELRSAAQLQHSEQMQKVSERAKKTTANRLRPPLNIDMSPSSRGGPTCCSCFPCNSHYYL
ncbi:unnamed protein product [Cuscuta epithymum]|uniref:Remorin C-terminal domain-containing protein n=3 Tax=Cuscuta epithymum TaxID=186058 RepID=A0AAV0FQ83_9ASTE|nr:unnamed protein product [Cuscuta epithymum]